VAHRFPGADTIFNHPGLRRLLLRARFPLGVTAAVGLMLLVRREWFVPGLGVSFFGAAWQWWCFGCIMTSKVLAIRGPYRIMRNPMYLARFFLMLGMLLMTGRLWIMAAFVPLYWLYMVNRVRREEQKLQALFGRDYQVYCAAVPRFRPAFGRFNGSRLAYFSRECFLRNHGPANAAVVFVLYAFLCYFAFRLNT
jgi:protein-S-isoprenylcysteine O-methyltransferase Ste14